MKIRDLFRALGVDDAAEARRSPGTPLDEAALIGNHADRDALDARIAADHLLREVGLELVELAIIEHGAQQVMHVVLHAMIGRQHVVETRRALSQAS